MKLLARISDQVLLQVLSDALSERGIGFRIDNAGMNGLMPLPVVMDARVMVAEEDLSAANLVLADLEIPGEIDA